MKIITGICLLLFTTAYSFGNEKTQKIKDDYNILNYDKSAHENLTRISKYLATRNDITGKLKRTIINLPFYIK